MSSQPPIDHLGDHLSDHLGRPLDDLRISVTDRCNFRCTFCMPADKRYDFLARREILTFEETTRLARIFVGLGVRKIRLTGGEPLLRAGLPTLIAALATLEGVEDLALTTNAALLDRQADALVEAGLHRVTVSLHALDPALFARLSGLEIPIEKVLRGLEAAKRAGLRPIKLNTVVIRGTNDHEIIPLARFAREHGHTLRFIEYMDVGTVNQWDPKGVFSAGEIVELIDKTWPLEALDRAHRGEVATRWRYRDGGGEIGVISSVTQPFCGDCTRARLSAEGKVFTCLFGQIGHDLKTPLRNGENDEALAERVRALWSTRADRYSEQRSADLAQGRFRPTEKIEMFRIGG